MGVDTDNLDQWLAARFREIIWDSKVKDDSAGSDALVLREFFKEGNLGQLDYLLPKTNYYVWLDFYK